MYDINKLYCVNMFPICSYRYQKSYIKQTITLQRKLSNNENISYHPRQTVSHKVQLKLTLADNGTNPMRARTTIYYVTLIMKYKLDSRHFLNR